MTDKRLTPDEIAAIEARLKKATPGPWQRSGVRQKLGNESCITVGPDGAPLAYLPVGSQQGDKYHAEAFKDADFIAHAPTDISALLSDRRALLERLKKYGDAILDVADKGVDDGDRAYFGSTNDFDRLKELRHDYFDYFRWRLITPPKKESGR